jgi:hypothetical protein
VSRVSEYELATGARLKRKARESGSLQPVQSLGVTRLKEQPADVSVKRGSVFHEHFYGKSAVPFIEDGHLVLQVWCKEDAGVVENGPVRYGVAVTIEAGIELAVYDEIQARPRVRPRPETGG